MGVLEPSSGRVASTFNHWATSPALPPFIFFKAEFILGLFKETFLEDLVVYTESKDQTHNLGLHVAQYTNFQGGPIIRGLKNLKQ